VVEQQGGARADEPEHAAVAEGGQYEDARGGQGQQRGEEHQHRERVGMRGDELVLAGAPGEKRRAGTVTGPVMSRHSEPPERETVVW